MRVRRCAGRVDGVPRCVYALRGRLLRAADFGSFFGAAGVETNETLERWTFAVNACDTENAAPSTAGDVKAITKQIQAIIRQITASVTFLPLLDEACAFDLLVYTRKTASVPGAWEDSDPKYIADSQEVKLRSFTTSVHSVEAAVAYKDHDA